MLKILPGVHEKWYPAKVTKPNGEYHSTIAGGFPVVECTFRQKTARTAGIDHADAEYPVLDDLMFF